MPQHEERTGNWAEFFADPADGESIDLLGEAPPTIRRSGATYALRWGAMQNWKTGAIFYVYDHVPHGADARH